MQATLAVQQVKVGTGLRAVVPGVWPAVCSCRFLRCVVKKHRTAMASLYPELLELNQQDPKAGAERGEELDF